MTSLSSKNYQIFFDVLQFILLPDRLWRILVCHICFTCNSIQFYECIYDCFILSRQINFETKKKFWTKIFLAINESIKFVSNSIRRLFSSDLSFSRWFIELICDQNKAMKKMARYYTTALIGLLLMWNGCDEKICGGSEHFNVSKPLSKIALDCFTSFQRLKSLIILGDLRSEYSNYHFDIWNLNSNCECGFDSRSKQKYFFFCQFC